MFKAHIDGYAYGGGTKIINDILVGYAYDGTQNIYAPGSSISYGSSMAYGTGAYVNHLMIEVPLCYFLGFTVHFTLANPAGYRYKVECLNSELV